MPEFPKISRTKYHFSKGYGMASDYFAEALHSMRKESLVSMLSKRIDEIRKF
jgi:ATP-dependent Lon protease